MTEKRIPLYLPLIMIVVVVLLCRNDLQSKENEITSYIMKNQDTLIHMASSVLNGGGDVVPLIDGINEITCWTGNDTGVGFKYYSIGVGQTAGTHYGFYYSPDDVPMAYKGQNTNLISAENGWSWIGENDSGFTKKIVDNWYYYETDF